jgi:hypothetical protein
MPDPSLDDLLASYSPDVRAMARRARELVLGALPDAVEKVHLGWRNVTFGVSPAMRDQLFVVQPLKSRVNLALFVGTGVPDPAGLLEGTGQSMRHVKVASLAALESPALAALLAAAVRAHAAWRVEHDTAAAAGEGPRGRRLPADRRGAPAPAGGYAVSGSKTVSVPLPRLYDAWADERRRARWLGDVAMVVRKATPEKSMRVAWPDGTRVDVLFAAKGDAKSQVSVDQRGAKTPADAERLRAFWKERLAVLKEQLEGVA